MVQSWYQGGIDIFDFTDPSNPIEIAFHDRGPVSAEVMQPAEKLVRLLVQRKNCKL